MLSEVTRGYPGRHGEVPAGPSWRLSGGCEKRLRSWTRLLYCSRMCSTPDARIALLGQAIAELAQQTMAGAGLDGGNTDAGMEGVAERLAAIWAMVAELDPGLAARLPRYGGPAD